jgi:DNA-binding XRE family transcriptional regulator
LGTSATFQDVNSLQGKQQTFKRVPLVSPAPPNRKLTELRLNRGWSPDQLGSFAGGLSGRAVRDIEDGRTREPRASTKLAIANALQVGITEIWPIRERQRA